MAGLARDRLGSLQRLLPNLVIERDCIAGAAVARNEDEGLSCCPAMYEVGAGRITSAVLSWEERGGVRSKSLSFNNWIVVNTFMKTELAITGRAGGNEVRWVMSSELPRPSDPEAVELAISLADMPSRAEEMLVDLKSAAEKRMGRSFRSGPGGL